MNTANKIEIYTTKNCSFCKKAKLLLEKYEVFSEIDVEDEYKRELMTKRSNGLRTVPQVFINDEHIGGYEQLKLLEQNNILIKLLK
jgi:glutaredoxin 3